MPRNITLTGLLNFLHSQNNFSSLYRIKPKFTEILVIRKTQKISFLTSTLQPT